MAKQATKNVRSKQKESAAQSEADASGSSLLRWIRPAAAFLIATLIVWSFLAPTDATSVFRGEALAQNLFWLIAACLCAGAVNIAGAGFRVSKLYWCVSVSVLLWLVGVTYFASIENDPRRGWNGFWQVVSLASCYLGVRYFVCGPQSRSVVLSICLAGCIASSIHGLYQVQIDFPAALAQYEQDPDGEIAKIPGLNAPPGSPQRIRFESRLRSPEPYANFALANSLATTLTAGLLLLGTLLAFSLAAQAEPSTKQSTRFKTITAGVVACLLVGACWFLTRSRTAYLAILVGGASATVLHLLQQGRGAGNKKHLALGFGTALLAVIAGVAWLAQNDELVLSESKKSLGFRLEYWQATVEMLREHWFFGVGLGNFQSYYPFYKLDVASEEIADPHNWMLDVGVTLSLPILFLGILWMARQFAFACWWSEKSTDELSLVEASSESDQKNKREIDSRTSKLLINGALAGGLICVLLLTTLMNFDIWVACIGWIPAAGLVYVLQPSIRAIATHNRFVIVAGPLAILVCLLASGSWQASGVAVPFLALLAASQPSTSTAFRKRGDALAGKSKPIAKMMVLILPVLGLGIFLVQAWLPVNKAWDLSQDAFVAGDASQQIRLAKEAAMADRLDAELHGWAAQGDVTKAVNSSRGTFESNAEQAIATLDEWLLRDANNFVTWKRAGNHVYDLLERASELSLEKTEVIRMLDEKSVEYYQKASIRHPTSVELRIQLATAFARVGRMEKAENEIQTAVAISEKTPHFDKKLGRHRGANAGDQLVWFPFHGVINPAKSASESPRMVPAEPLIEWMRTNAGVQD